MVCTPFLENYFSPIVKHAVVLGQRKNSVIGRTRWKSTIPFRSYCRYVTLTIAYLLLLKQWCVPDRRPALLSVLRSLLVTYSALASSLLAPPPTSSSSAPPDWQRHVEWITILGQNIMAAANDLRPVQVSYLDRSPGGLVFSHCSDTPGER